MSAKRHSNVEAFAAGGTVGAATTLVVIDLVNQFTSASISDQQSMAAQLVVSLIGAAGVVLLNNTQTRDIG